MKMTSRAAIAAAAFAILVPATAYADCPGAGKTYTSGTILNPSYTTGWPYFVNSYNGGQSASWLDSGSETDPDCFTEVSVSYNGTAATGEIVDSAAPNLGLYTRPQTVVVGPNGVALGNGASVGRVEEYEEGGVTQTRIVPVADGTALGARATVQHDHSTAVGADSETDRENQIVLGTEDDEVTVRNLTKNTADKADTAGIVVHKADGTLASDGGRIQSEIDANTVKLDEHTKGLAIAMAMPDAWLSDSKSFGVFGSIGGFDGETAIGLAAIGRIDETWSINTKLGVDTDFEHVGWQLGAGAQW